MEIRDDKLKTGLEKVRQLLQQGKFPDAVALANSIRRGFEGADPSELYARALMMSGVSYQYRGEMWSAEHYLEKASLMYEEVGLPGDAILANSYRIRCISDYGDMQRAVHLGTQSLDKARQIKRRDLEARVLSSLGIVCLKMNRVPDAGDYTIQAIDIFHELGDEYNAKHSTIQLANFYAVSRRVEDSRRILEQGIADAREKGDESYESWLQMNMGSIHYRQNSYDAARESFRLAIKLGGDSGISGVRAHAHQGLGLTELRAGNLDKARNHLLRSAHLANSFSIFLVENLSLIYQGVIDLYEFDYTEAISKFDLVQHRVISNCHLEKGLVNYYQSIAYLLSGNLTQADRLFEERLPIRRADEYLDDFQITSDLINFLMDAQGRGEINLGMEQVERLNGWLAVIREDYSTTGEQEATAEGAPQ